VQEEKNAETSAVVYIHEVNLGMTSDYEGKFEPDHNNIKEYVDHILSEPKFEGTTIVFHIGQGFDFQFFSQNAPNER
jgi:hypothetical protein